MVLCYAFGLELIFVFEASLIRHTVHIIVAPFSSEGHHALGKDCSINLLSV